MVVSKPMPRREAAAARHGQATFFVAALAALAVGSAACAGAVHAGRPFTVVDSIEMTEIVEPLPTYRWAAPHEFKRSPDGKRFVAVLRRGHLDTNEVEYQLVQFDAASVLAAVNADAPVLPPRDVILAMRTSTGRHAIEQVKWRDADRLAFIGREGESPGQVYSLDLRTRSLQKLTEQPTGVFNFDIGAAETLVYSAPVFPDWKERNQRGYVVGATVVENLTITGPNDAVLRDLAFFVEDPKGGASSRVSNVGLNSIATAWGSLPVPNEIAISPNGRFAIVLATPKTISDSWIEYGFVQEYLSHFPPQDRQRALDEWVPQEALARRSVSLKQYFLVDLDHAQAKPLLHSPGASGWNTQVLWSPDSGRVVLSPTFMPLDGSRGEERARRRAASATVEVDVQSGTFARITDSVQSVSKLEWLRDGGVRVEWLKGDKDFPVASQFRKRGQQWSEVRAIGALKSRLELRIEEDMNTPPEIVAVDNDSARKRVITDLNPQLRAVTLGREEVFEWRDRFGRRYSGGLVFPPDANSAPPYPAVLQTDGYNPGEFLVDGPGGMSTAYAARAMTNKGMLVLQMPVGHIPGSDSPEQSMAWRYDRDGENPRFVAMMEGAIDSLTERGLIDRSRVGLIGFSREGMHVQYALTFSDYPIAAATIAHSVQMTPFAYALGHGRPYPGGPAGFEDKALIGAPFWGEGVKSWMERSPAFHLDRIRTPLRFEHLETNVPEYWDTFMALKRHRRPVEMIHIPFAEHQLERPAARYTSQQGNVDWFAFWLNGEVDKDPAKADQYERWRILRNEHEAQRLEKNGE